MKRLIIDIETAPNLAYVWETWNVNVNKETLLDPKHMLCFAAKWYREDKMFFYSENKHGTERMVGEAHKLLSQADAVIHFNGRRFDVPHLQTEFLKIGSLPPSPFKQIDLYEVVKKQFEFPYNSLSYVTRALGLPHKVETGGFQLWLDCIKGDKKAWKQMEFYNRNDVEILEPLYDLLLPWIPNHPSFGAMYGGDMCPSCGGLDLVREGFAYTAVGKFQRYHCGDCGKWSRATKRVDGTGITHVAG